MPGQSPGSISIWIPGLLAGSETASQEVARRFFKRVVGLARAKLESRGIPRRMADEEDVANSVLMSFLQAAQKGRLPSLSHRDEMWRIIASITAGKVIDLRRHETAQKRGGGVALDDEAGVGIEHLPADDSDPAVVVAAGQELDALLGCLPEDLLHIAEQHLQGYTYREIAERSGGTEHMVRRRVERILATWRKKLAG